MEPVTHFLTGACLARAGCNRKAAYATLAMTLAAEMPDLDTVWTFGGPVTGLEHHRGITHTFAGVPFEAAAVVGLMWLIHRWRVSRGKTTAAAPVRWGLLYFFSVVALLSHILLDWTNNYGVRPFFPFNPRWYAGSFVFIFEPVMFALLVLALVGPWFFGLIGSEVGAKRQVFRGQGWAVFALLGISALWGWRWLEHEQALALLNREYFGGAAKVRMFASPHMGNPYLWSGIVETPDDYRLATVDVWRALVTSSERDVVYKPPTTLATLVAKRSYLGEIYLDWSQWPVVEQTGLDEQGDATVTFRDLRFARISEETGGLAGKPEHPPLSGTVTVDAERRVVAMEFDGRLQQRIVYLEVDPSR
jgi:inner membrane protein